MERGHAALLARLALIGTVLLGAAGCASLTGKKAAPGAGAASAADSLPADDTASAVPAPAQPSIRVPEGDSAAADSVGKETAHAPEPPSGPVTTTDVKKLEEMGPVYTPSDIGPMLAPGDWLGDLLEDTLVPVIKKYHLSPDRAAYFWVLVDDQGEVRDVVLHTSSGHGAFDHAARAAALHLHYLAAHRDGQRVPVWVLARVSLLMR